ncbi:MAG: hypothetical protein CGU28_14295 [Candidatus Dactylopiibacterium carminicum]|uniref:Uncharacterized protein n=1 Tax=Candidatus Dactylopiibacterium carminicum TaxID=857335 RepID=A0A272ENT1_9RHOO|nr:hypothetical protein [Candidatus Dactylopiibacterium carminicum]KAF7598133.1 hypothetical protein BGI27_14915 [Candidatus Dactylopiibacterium carminicum]PAS91761.1 MAG: hypothetical protein CGU29_14680 [Candidatus Dactylopiibacterium carminicum]PAS94132.1 MAG: hypothetical protein CGU28_14295 [Candidatus Dactylopiibacterium carminicum]PAS96724.1 MAG: hypothetical protein BSR46_14955 [Candidatus Dactylopiibacterium carminicum]
MTQPPQTDTGTWPARTPRPELFGAAPEEKHEHAKRISVLASLEDQTGTPATRTNRPPRAAILTYLIALPVSLLFGWWLLAAEETSVQPARPVPVQHASALPLPRQTEQANQHEIADSKPALIERMPSADHSSTETGPVPITAGSADDAPFPDAMAATPTLQGEAPANSGKTLLSALAEPQTKPRHNNRRPSARAASKPATPQVVDTDVILLEALLTHGTHAQTNSTQNDAKVRP